MRFSNSLKINVHLTLYVYKKHTRLKDEMKWMREWGGHIFLSHGSSNQRGVSILIEKNNDYVIHTTLRDTKGRWIIVDCTIKSL